MSKKVLVVMGGFSAEKDVSITSGQGIANAVGMALAEKLLAEEFNQDGLHFSSK